MLTDDGKPLQERLDALAKAGINLAAANDEVGLYAQTALLVLTKYKPKIDELTIAYQNAKGETEKMARAMEDNLATAITKVGTAYDALILSLRSSNGVLKDGATTIASILRTFASPDISGLQKYALLIGSIANPAMVGQFNNLSKAIENLNKVRDDATAKKDQLIEDSAIVLLRDYGQAIDDVNLALAGNENAEAIRLRYLDLAKQALIQQAQALVDQTKAQDDANRALKEAIQLEYEQSEQDRARRIRKHEEDTGTTGDFKPKSLADKYGVDLMQKIKQISTTDQSAAALEGIQKLIDSLKSLSIETEKSKLGWEFWGDAVSDVLDNVIAKDQDFARSAAETAARIIDSTRKEIAAYIAKAAAKALALNPTPAGIATASTIIGVGLSIVSGVLKRFAKTSDENVRVSGARYNSLQFAPVTFRQRGTDLIGVISETDRLNSRTRG